MFVLGSLARSDLWMALLRMSANYSSFIRKIQFYPVSLLEYHDSSAVPSVYSSCYYPFFGGVGLANREDGEGDVEDGSYGVKLRKNYTSEYGEPVVLRCGYYRLPLIELLVPYALSTVEFYRICPSLAAIAEYTGAYTHESVGINAATGSGGYMEPAVKPFLSGLRALSSKPFHKMCSHVLRTVAGFQIKLVDEISADVRTWLDDLTNNAVREVSEEEVEAAAADKIKRFLEILDVIKAMPPPQSEPELDTGSDDDSLLPSLETKPKKRPTTVLFLKIWSIRHCNRLHYMSGRHFVSSKP